VAALFNLDTTPVQRNVPGSAGIQGALRRGHRDRPPGRPDLLCNGRLWKYLHIAAGVFLVDDAALRDTADALAIAEQSGDDFALGSALLARGIILANRDAPESDVGYDLLAKARDMALAHRFSLDVVPFVDIHTAMRKVQTKTSTAPSTRPGLPSTTSSPPPGWRPFRPIRGSSYTKCPYCGCGRC